MSPRSSAARALPLLLLAVTLSGLACTSPTYADLEKERPRQCNAEHPCADGYTCVNGVCVTGTPQVTECEPNAERPCGDFDKGECRKGVQRCGQDGKWDTVCAGEVRPTLESCNGLDDDCDGLPDDQIAPAACALTAGVCAGRTQACLPNRPSQVCDASTYGSDYELTETRCDNQDNDCDGQTDEDLTTACEKTQGVCAGTVKLCRDGAFPAAACTDDEYLARNQAYETFELTCDGLDNDCDGGADKWDVRNLSSSSRASTAPEIATIPGGDGLSAVVLYEEEGQVLTQVIGPTGAARPRAPSSTLYDKAYGPVLATDGQLMAASWIEVSNGTTRVMLTLLGVDGTSVLKGGGATTLFNDVSPLVPGRLSLAVNNGRIAVAMEDRSTGERPFIRLTTVRASVADSSITLEEEMERTLIVSDTTSVSRQPHVSAAEADAFNVAWQASGKVSLKTIKPDGNTARNIAGVGPLGASNAQVFTTLPAGKTLVYFVETLDSIGRLRVVECGAQGCSTPTDAPFSNATGTSMGELSLVAPAFGEQPTLALWTEVSDTGSIPVRYSARTSDGKYTLGTLTPDSANGAHPVATFVGAAGQRTLLTAFASDNSGGLTAGEIYVRPLCAP